MEEISVIGVDLAKNVFELCALSVSGEVVWTKRMKRLAFLKFMDESAPRCLVGMEACGGAHHWGRWLLERGFRVKLMAPKPVRAYRQGVHKSDARDARAIAEAASRSHVGAVRVKSERAQLIQALVRLRTRRVRQMVQTTNQLRGLLNEFGIILPKGHKRMLVVIEQLRAEAMPRIVADLASELCREVAAQNAQVEEATAELREHVKDDEVCSRLMSVPNIGPINAATLSVELEMPGEFANGKAFAAKLGLVPRQAKSGEKDKLAGIPRQTANETRRHLVLAAQSLLTRVKRMKELPDDRFLHWAHRMLERKHRNVAAVAVAAKLARIAWTVEANGRAYTPRPAA